MRSLTALVLSILLAPTMAAAAPTCPATFAAFLTKYRTNTTFQRAHTGPLIATHLVAADPEPKRIAKTLTPAEVAYPAIPPVRAQRKAGEVMTIEDPQGSNPVVTFRKPDTNRQVRFTFQRGECWTLVRRDDDSL